MDSLTTKKELGLRKVTTVLTNQTQTVTILALTELGQKINLNVHNYTGQLPFT